jgi:HSP20 family protein
VVGQVASGDTQESLLMSGDLIRLMQSFFLPAASAMREAIWQPSVDVYRTRCGWLIKFELAGVRPEDLQLTVNGRRLTVRGVRRDWFVEEECTCYRMEISYSQFERSIDLPVEVDANRVRTDYQHGLLLVHITTEGNP